MSYKAKTKTILSLVLMICMIFNMMPSNQVAAATKTEASKAAITRGQVCQMVNSLLGATVKAKEMKDIVNYKKSDKYYSAMSIAYNAGYIIPYEEGKICKATVKATYNFVATVFSRILETSKSKVIGKHKYSKTMTLADFQTYLSEVIPSVITKNTSKKEFVGNIIVNKPDLKLTDVTIKGNLIIGDGVADKEVTLDNVTVTGKLIVRGGGENSVIIKGNSQISTVVILQVNNTVSIKVSGDANVQMVYINDGCNDVILNGTFGSVNVTGSDINLSANNASISDVVLTGVNTSLNVTAGTTISNVTLAETAENAKVDITGIVNNVVAQSSNSEIKVDDKGTVSSITASESAAGIKIDVSIDASVNSVTSNAQETIVSGDGKVEKATMNGDNSQISTPDTVVIVGANSKGVKDNTDISATPAIVASTTPIPTIAPTLTPTLTPASGGGSIIGGGSSTPIPASTATPIPASTATPIPASTATPTPTSTVTPTPADGTNTYVTDDRFEVGYPQVVLGTKVGSTTNVTVSLKLKEGIATEASPAVIYYIVSNSNALWDASSNSVMHGHLGTDDTYDTGTYHPLIFCNFSGAIKVTNTDVVEVPLTIYGSGDEGMVTYFVIKTASATSEVPTKIAFTGETVSSFTDTYKPSVDSPYLSKATTNSEGKQQRTIRLFVSEILASTSTVSGSAFTLSGITEGSITDVIIHNNTPGSGPYNNWIDLTLTYSTADVDFSNLTIEYAPSEGLGFTDVANIPNKMDNFILYSIAPNEYFYEYSLIKDAEPLIKTMSVSDDGKYISLLISPQMTSIYDCNIKIDGELWEVRSSSYSYDWCTLYLFNETATKKSSYTIEITSEAEGGKIIDVMGQEYDSVSKIINNPIDSSITATVATLDLSDKTLKLTLAGNCSDVNSAEYSCQYVVNIDGVSYRLRSRASRDYSISDTEGAIFTFEADNMFDVDFSNVTTLSVATISLSSLSTFTGFNNGFTEASGKPMEAFNINITITE